MFPAFASDAAPQGKLANENEVQWRGLDSGEASSDRAVGGGSTGRGNTHRNHPMVEETRVSGCGTENTVSSETSILFPTRFQDQLIIEE